MKQFYDAKVFNTRLPSFAIPKIGSLTHETKIKDAVNMEDLICLLATVRTLKGVLHPRPVFGLFLHFSQKLKHFGNK